MGETEQLKRAADHLRAGQRGAALTLLSEYIQNRPDSDTAWYLISFALPDHDKKLKAVQRALKINPQNKLARARENVLNGGVGGRPTAGSPGAAGGVAPARRKVRRAPEPQRRPAIEVENLGRVYKTRTGVIRRSTKEVLAVDDISFGVRPGELFGLLGPNGAGKTTTVKMLTTLLIPTSGTARVAGFDVVEQPQEIRQRIGFIFGGERGLYWRLSGHDNLRYFASLYHVDPTVADKRIPHLLDLVGLQERADEKVEGYSRGMKQRLHVARTLLHDPQILFLDEPTIGLDPVGARRLRGVIREMQAERKTILLTTHYMFEADALCDRIGVIDHGKIVALDTPEGLKKHVRDLSVIEVEVFGIAQGTIEQLRGEPFVDTVAVEDRDQRQYLKVHTPRGSEAVSDIIDLLRGVRVGRVQVREPTLEDAYVRLVDGGETGDQSL